MRPGIKAPKPTESEKELMAKGWIRTWMLFEVQAMQKDVVESALKQHIEKMSARDDVKSIETKYAKVDKVEIPAQFKKPLEAKGIKNLYSQVVECIILAQNFESLTNIVINYAPTAIEIIAPDKIVLSMRDAQHALSNVTDMMHKFARAGIGGMLVSGE